MFYDFVRAVSLEKHIKFCAYYKITQITNPQEAANGVSQSFRPLSDISEGEQEHLIALAMEATGLKQYQRWNPVEYTIIVCIRSGAHPPPLYQVALQAVVDFFFGVREFTDFFSPSSFLSVGFDQE